LQILHLTSFHKFIYTMLANLSSKGMWTVAPCTVHQVASSTNASAMINKKITEVKYAQKCWNQEGTGYWRAKSMNFQVQQLRKVQQLHKIG